LGYNEIKDDGACALAQVGSERGGVLLLVGSVVVAVVFA
jgi:hypothetical protein